MQYSSLSFKSKSDIYYSVDMVRLNFEFSKDSAGENLIRYIKMYDGEKFNVVSIRKFVLFKYQYHYTIKTISGNVLVIEHYFYDETSEGMRKGFIEFNPNKFISEDDHMILTGFLNVLADDILFNANYYTSVFNLARWDLAIDIPERREDVYLTQDKRNYQYIKSRTGITQYLGVRNSGGFVKLYDKTKESKLNELLTRLEITFDGYDYPTLPQVYIKRCQARLALGLNDTQMVLVELLNKLEPDEKEKYFRRLGRGIRNTIKDAVYCDNQLEYDFEAISYLMDKLNLLEKGIIEDNFYKNSMEFHYSPDMPFK